MMGSHLMQTKFNQIWLVGVSWENFSLGKRRGISIVGVNLAARPFNEANRQASTFIHNEFHAEIPRV